MVYARRYRRRPFTKRRARPARRRRKRVYKKGVPSKAFRGRIDTKLEKMVVRLAKKEVAKGRVNLVHRTFFNWPDEEPTFDYAVPDMGNEVDFDGQVLELSQIPLRNPTAGDLPVSLMNGTRASTVVKITGITVGLRVAWKRFAQDSNDTYEKNTLHFSVVKWRSRLNAYMAHQLIPDAISQNDIVLINGVRAEGERGLLLFESGPKVKHLLPLTPWGYSSRLDNVDIPMPAMPPPGVPNIPLPENLFVQAGAYSNHKTLWRSKCSSRYHDDDKGPNIQKITKFIRFKTPLKIDYSVTQTNGARILSPFKLFLVIRSQIPAVIPDYLPSVAGFFKLHYFE